MEEIAKRSVPPAPARTISGGVKINTKIVRAIQEQQAAAAEALEACQQLNELVQNSPPVKRVKIR